LKRNTDSLPKFKGLMKELGLPRYAVMGVLEAIWELTGKHAPRGNVGKFSNQEIADDLGWEGDADKLIAALVTHRWIDACRTHRLVIHDWKDHAPDWLKKAVVRSGESWAEPDSGSQWQPVAASGGQRQPVAASGSQWQPTRPDQTYSDQTRPQQQQQQQGPDAVAVAEVFALATDQQRRYETLFTRPLWLPEDKPWIDASTARRLARMPTTTDELIAHVMRDAKAAKKTLQNPAGLVIKNLSKPDPDLVAAIAARAQASQEAAA